MSKVLARAAGGFGPAVAFLVAALVFGVAYDDGSFGLEQRGTIAIAVLWAVILGGALGFLPFGRIPRTAWIAGGALAGFMALSATSALWAASAENAILEATRISLYLGVLVLVVLASQRSTAARWLEGLALGIGAVAVVALGSRFFPHLFPGRGLATFLPDSENRLSFPLGYWNGLAVFLGIGIPLAAAVAVLGTRRLVRAAALGSLPALAAAIYLASSRGGVAAAIVGVAVLVVLADERARLFTAFAIAGVGTAAELALLGHFPRLVDGPPGTHAAIVAGREAAVGTLVIAILVGAAHTWAPTLSLPRPSRRVGWAAAGVAAVGIVVVLVLADLPARFDAFRQPPSAVSFSQNGFAQAHILSGNGSGRWQFWGGAIGEFRHHPVLGGGAGSFEEWWAAHGSISYYIRDAHSIYIEVLGELGIPGLLLVLTFVGCGLVAGVRAARGTRSAERTRAAALTAGFAAYAVGAGLDWMWELTAVTIVGMILLGLLVGPATVRGNPDSAELDRSPAERSLGPLYGLAGIAIAWLLIALQVVVLVTQLKIDDSQAAVRNGNLRGALSAARTAHTLEPWASTPLLQIALVQEQSGDLQAARRSIRRAIAHDGQNWRLWLVRTRLETKLGEIPAALASLHRARSLNPRSPIFENLGVAASAGTTSGN